MSDPGLVLRTELNGALLGPGFRLVDFASQFGLVDARKVLGGCFLVRRLGCCVYSGF